MVDLEIHAGLKTKTFARQLHCYRRLGSTNIRAKQLADAGAPEGTVVVAEEQTKGRGRLGRSWHSAAGLGIWSSVILRPRITPAQASGISLVAALAFAETAESELGLTVDLKWPNDALIGGRKVLGILTEASIEGDRLNHVVCGTGINVNHSRGDFPPSLHATAGSLAMAKGERIDRVAFFRAFLKRFESLYRRFCRAGLAPLLPAYRERSILLGKRVTVTHGKRTITGVAEGIDDTGALILTRGGSTAALVVGDATLEKGAA